MTSSPPTWPRHLSRAPNDRSTPVWCNCPIGRDHLLTWPVERPDRTSWDDVWMQMAHVIAQRSLCDRDQVGAVVVSAANRIVDTGYNGPPRGMSRGEPSDLGCTHWCPRGRKVEPSTPGAYIGGQFTPLDPAYNDCHTIHAEANALLFGDRTQREGGTIYVSSGVCGMCAKLIANSGLVRLVCDVGNSPPHASHRGSNEWFAWLRLCGIECVEVGLAST